MRYKCRFVTTTSNSGAYVFLNASSLLSLYAFYEYMFLRRIKETKFVPSVLVNSEKQSDNESSDERQINVQQIFVCTKTGNYKSYWKNIICIFNIHVFRRYEVSANAHKSCSIS